MHPACSRSVRRHGGLLLCAGGSGVRKVLTVAGPSPPVVSTCTSSRYRVDGLRLDTVRALRS